MNKEEKTQKRFWDNCLNRLTPKKFIIGIVVFYFFIFVATNVISYNIITFQCQDEFDYPEKSFEFLDKFAQIYIEEGKEYVDLENNLRIAKYEVIHEDNKIVLKAYMDNEKRYAKACSIEVELSKKYEILNTTYSYASKEEYIKDIRENISSSSFGISILVELVMMLLGLKLFEHIL